MVAFRRAVGSDHSRGENNADSSSSPSPIRHSDADDKLTERSDPEFSGANVDFSSVDAKATLRKMDIRLIPMLALLYLLSFLDRGNIGNAKIEGLIDTLGMTDPQYNWCLTVFFFTYAAFEVPSNLLLKRLRPSIWLPTIMVAWGTVMTLMGIVQNYRGLLTARLFLGLTEAGLYLSLSLSTVAYPTFATEILSEADKIDCRDVPGLYPGVAYYITMWYTRTESQFRQAMFFSAASVAGAFSGLLAFGIAKMDGVGGLEGWRWIFILEGIATVLVALVAFWTIFDFPETASFLTTEERAWVVHRLKYQGSSESGQNVAENDEFQWQDVKNAFLDWQIYVALFSSSPPFLIFFFVYHPFEGFTE
ncbi:MAG: hypothetical protein M1825_003954 [Sarcosagium campestre]|nr:MAG: hypothetical protein M1825_003954 [Sarcosagium campestre]